MELSISICENSFWARIAARQLKTDNAAIVFGNKIHLYNCSRSVFLENKKWLCHELQHVVQYQRLGCAKFLFLYFYYSLKHGYYNNPFEVEARENEANYKLLENLKIKDF